MERQKISCADPPDVVCVGQAVVDCITRGIRENTPVPGRTQADSISLNTGGDAVNESFALADMGIRAALVCVVGKDPAGRFILDEAAKRGVMTDRITVSGTLATPVANMFVKEDGSRRSITGRAASLPGYAPDPALLVGAKVVSLASLFRAPLEDADTIRALIRRAHEQGAVICADTKLPTFAGIGPEAIEDVLPLIDYLFPNETEAAWYTGESTFEKMGQRLLAYGVRHVVIKTGPEGLYACSREECFALPAVPVQAVDTTGAGDNLVAGFISGILRGESFRACCDRGLRRAALSIGHLGAN